MNNRQVLIVVAVVILAVGGVALLLATGGSDAPPTPEDPPGDVRVGDGPKPPADPQLADVVRAEVREESEQVVFEAVFAKPVPEKLRGEELNVAWNLTDEAQETWQVTSSITLDAFASVFGEATGFSLGTLDQDSRGPEVIDLAIDGNTLTIGIDHAEVPEFPTSFTWALTVSLDGDQGDATSGRAEDRAPDFGANRFALAES